MIIAVANLKGGCGKTTSAIGLATAAARDGKTVKVLDADSQASACLWAEYAEEASSPLPFAVDVANMVTMKRQTKTAKGSWDEWVIIDCPPSGNVIDAAAEIADMVVVPTGTGQADFSKAFAVTQTLEANEKTYAVLITQARKNTSSLNSTLIDLNTHDVSFFETIIYQREDLKAYYGNAFGSDLYGYEAVYDEIKECLEEE